MLSTIKSIIKSLSIFSLFATLVFAGLSNINASAQSACPAGSYRTVANGPCIQSGTGNTPGGASGLTPALCGAGSVSTAGGISSCPLLGNRAGGLASKDAVTTFLLNIAKFFIYIASAVAVLFIVFGGYLYIKGDEASVKTGKALLINALIGLAICILAITIVTFIGSTLESNLLSTIGQ